MIEDVGRIGIEADGVGVADEVDLVAAGGEFHAEFGGDDATAAIRGVAGDADAHRFSMHASGRDVVDWLGYEKVY